MPNPNTFAYIALLGWPLIALILFLSLRASSAAFCCLLLPQLFLPVQAQIKIEFLPPIDKVMVGNLVLLGGCLIFATPSRQKYFGTTLSLVLLYCLSPLVTGFFNSSPAGAGVVYIPGVGLYDACSAIRDQTIGLIPFFVGYRYFRSEAQVREFLSFFVAAVSLYSLLLLFEVRFSPQLHYWFYGYYPSEFVQEVRDGGFRPMAFMGHGLTAASLVANAAIAAATIARFRSGPKHRLNHKGIFLYLNFVLLVSKSLAATVYSTVLGSAVLFLKPRNVTLLACLLAVASLTYPALRIVEVFPTGVAVDLARQVSNDRARSLEYRFANEEVLLDRANQQPLYGWGRYGRNRVFDPDTGKDLAVTDGLWIITFGQYGWLGFIGQFGLLSLGIFRALQAGRRLSGDISFLLAGLAATLAAIMINLIPNASLLPSTWMIAGCAIGLSEAILLTVGPSLASRQQGKQLKPEVFESHQ